MKSCNSFRDLAQFGIVPLTGEADALGFRILCDLTPQGVQVFQTCYGLVRNDAHTNDPPPPGFADNWNSGGVASVMLTGHDIVPLAIIGFYLKGYTVVLTRDKKDHETVFALEEGEKLEWEPGSDDYMLTYDSESRPWPKGVYGEVFRIITQPKGGQVRGDRNVHQMSGRAL